VPHSCISCATHPHFRRSRGVKYLCPKINYRPNITALRVEQSNETGSGHGTGTDFLLGQRRTEYSGAGGVVGRSTAMNVGLSRDGKYSFITDLVRHHKECASDMCLICGRDHCEGHCYGFFKLNAGLRRS